MQIVLPGALPDAAIAQELASHMEEKAPCFTGWLSHAQAAVVAARPEDTFCTAYEFWLLHSHGYQAEAGKRASAGLAALLASQTEFTTNPNQPLWLGQLVHVAPARDGAALIPASELEITPEESEALFNSAAESLASAGFLAEPFDTAHWRLTLPAGYAPDCASPALVSITSVNDWWTQDTAGRPWRRLVNELQMLWFDHPVNRGREARGLRPVNSLWLYGGGAPSRMTVPTDAVPRRVLRALQGPALVQDWGSWLHELERLDHEEFAALPAMPPLVLTGTNRIVELRPTKRGFLNRLLKQKQDWRRWWSSRD